MDTSLVMDIAVESLRVTVLVAAPILAAALMSGLLVGILQAATSINEATISFVPKLVVVLLAMALLSTFMMREMVDYFAMIFDQIRMLQ